jgi:hypothetical protein
MYSKQQVIDFVKYSMSKIDSDKSLESIFDEWDSENSYDKTRKHFLIHISKLKSPYAEQAIENYDDEFAEDININIVNDVEQCLNHAFDWQYTLQGFDYWSEIYVNIDKYLK